MSTQLLPTLQTSWGMVLNNGRPQSRPFPSHIPFQSNDAVKPLSFNLPIPLPDFYEHNLLACNQAVTRTDLLAYISNRKKLDIEQAVAMIISFLPASVSTELADEFREGFTKTHMWRSEDDYEVHDDPRKVAKANRMNVILELLSSERVLNRTIDEEDLVPALQSLRRFRPKLDNCQRLRFPSTLLDRLPTEEDRTTWSELWGPPQSDLTSFPPETHIVPRHLFRRIQAQLARYDNKNDDDSVLVLEIDELEKAVMVDTNLKSLQNTEDDFALAYSFMASQRELQLKVVSDQNWTTFLAKGEGSQVLQNTPHILTSFESILVAHAKDQEALCAVRTPSGLHPLASTNNATTLLKRSKAILDLTSISLLMERYVLLYSQKNDPSTLVSQSRGPVDLYNQLVDLLRHVAQENGLKEEVGKSFKFLAKDIMHWNRSWDDDAFAGGKEAYELTGQAKLDRAKQARQAERQRIAEVEATRLAEISRQAEALAEQRRAMREEAEQWALSKAFADSDEEDKKKKSAKRDKKRKVKSKGEDGGDVSSGEEDKPKPKKKKAKAPESTALEGTESVEGGERGMEVDSDEDEPVRSKRKTGRGGRAFKSNEYIDSDEDSDA